MDAAKKQIQKRAKGIERAAMTMGSIKSDSNYSVQNTSQVDSVKNGKVIKGADFKSKKTPKQNPNKQLELKLEETDKYNVSEEGLRDWFGKSSGTTKSGRKVRGWVQVGGKYDGKPCARQPGQKSTPKCVSSS